MQVAPARNTRNQSEQSRIEAAVQCRLHEGGYSQLWNVKCRYSAETAVLTGQVSSFYMKQVAQTIVSRIEGVEKVDNLLDVVVHNKRK